METFMFYLVIIRVGDRNDENINGAIQETQENGDDLEAILRTGGIASL